MQQLPKTFLVDSMDPMVSRIAGCTTNDVLEQFFTQAVQGSKLGAMALAYVARRLKNKQPAPAHYVTNQAVLQSLADEGWREVRRLLNGNGRNVVLWNMLKYIPSWFPLRGKVVIVRFLHPRGKWKYASTPPCP